MARTVRDAKLDSRASRLRLERGKEHFAGVHEGLAIVYRRPVQGSGTWAARLLVAGVYRRHPLGTADDHADADGINILSFKHAQLAAIAREQEVRRSDGGLDHKLTVAKAAESYLAWFRGQRKGIVTAESAVRTHILPAFGDRAVASLRSAELTAWLAKMATTPARLRSSKFAATPNARKAPKSDDEKRARRNSVNRIWNVFRALLNKAFENGQVADNATWRKVKPFKNVDEARIRFLTDAESVRLVNACPSDLRALVRGALLTGARRGELADLTASNVDLRTSSIYIAVSKSGKPRHVPLNPEGKALFTELVKGKTGDALVFQRSDGRAWKHNDHVRALTEACRVAKVRPAISIHELRHTYASHLAQAGVPLLTIATLLGHSDTRITAKHYAHLCNKTLADAVAILPSFEPDERAAAAGAEVLDIQSAGVATAPPLRTISPAGLRQELVESLGSFVRGEISTDEMGRRTRDHQRINKAVRAQLRGAGTIQKHLRKAK